MVGLLSFLIGKQPGYRLSVDDEPGMRYLHQPVCAVPGIEPERLPHEQQRCRHDEADADRQVGIVKETRTAAEAAYRSLVDTVNALAMINGDTAYATFIDHVNAMIERQKAISKARSTRAKKEDEPAE